MSSCNELTHTVPTLNLTAKSTKAHAFLASNIERKICNVKCTEFSIIELYICTWIFRPLPPLAMEFH